MGQHVSIWWTSTTAPVLLDTKALNVKQVHPKTSEYELNMPNISWIEIRGYLLKYRDWVLLYSLVSCHQLTWYSAGIHYDLQVFFS